MHQAVRKTIETYLKESRIPPLEEIGLKDHESAQSKDPAFVTFYKDGKVVASSGRIHLRADSTAKELVENALLCLKDPRFTESVRDGADFANVRIRVDVLPVAKRRVLQNISALNVRKEGLIFLSQSRNKVSVLLPGIANLAETPEQLLSIAMRKAWVDPASIPSEEYVLYGIETVVSSDF